MVYVVNSVLASGVDRILEEDFVFFCSSRDGNSSIDALNPNSFNDPPNVFTHPPQPQYESYSYPEDSLIMRNEELNTISEKESRYVNKVCVEGLVLFPKLMSEEYIPGVDSDNVNPLFDEVLENIESKDSYVSNLDKLTLLVTPLSDANEDECFEPGGKIDEIDAFLYMDISMDIKNGYHDSEGDIIYLESLLINDTIPNLPPEVRSEDTFLTPEHPPSFYSCRAVCDMRRLASFLSRVSWLVFYVQDCPDYKDSRARGFVHRSLDLQSLACLFIGIRYPRSY
ncbi:hypothetical protein Tco_0403356 [Tanacetum coccineum]